MQDKPIHSTTWQTPSNLAIVKYWGKKGIQEPANPSVSFSLSEATTTTRVSITPCENSGFTFKLDGLEVPSFEKKIQKFLDRVKSHVPFIKDHLLKIESNNTFPHSSGIASSASAMSALAFCLADLHQQVSKKDHLDISEVSSMARLGSGSASRSVYGGWNLWGRLAEIPESSDHFAIPVPVDVAPVFQNFHDDILIVNSSEKRVSSSAGHALMDNHPYRDGRIAQARENAMNILKHLQSGNIEGFIEIAESEALSLHGLMMSSKPAFSLLQPNTLILIEKVRQFRENTGIPVSFTIDAGPNVHLLYPNEHVEAVFEWEEEALRPFYEGGMIKRDGVGMGPGKVIEGMD